MKARLCLSSMVSLPAILLSQITHAQLTWDANGTGTGQTNGGGEWIGTNLWWNRSANQDWISGSNAIFGGPNTTAAAVSLVNSPIALGAAQTWSNKSSGAITITLTGTATSRLFVDVKVTQK
jgi:hypothetical protein